MNESDAADPAFDDELAYAGETDLHIAGREERLGQMALQSLLERCRNDYQARRVSRFHPVTGVGYFGHFLDRVCFEATHEARGMSVYLVVVGLTAACRNNLIDASYAQWQQAVVELAKLLPVLFADLTSRSISYGHVDHETIGICIVDAEPAAIAARLHEVFALLPQTQVANCPLDAAISGRRCGERTGRELIEETLAECQAQQSAASTTITWEGERL